MNTDYNFGKVLKALRTEQNISQQKLAKRLNVSQDTVSLWELNKSLPDFMSIRELAKIFDVSADFLLGLSAF
ncbi:MAG: helix-turn-helix domain-containing protein [Clostridiales bacterium]|jgi:transcriptional regulator with XRE-family HTH domain|nr:helix-turn-helix domain-containing protein [Clostridiales bacterium]